MLCEQFEKDIWNYIDGRLSPGWAEKYSAHLEGCGRCRNELARVGELLELLRDEQPPPPPAAYRESFWPRLKEKILAREEIARPRLILRFNPLYYATLGTAAAALILWVSLRAPVPSPIYSVGGAADYIMATVARTAPPESPAIDYISGSAIPAGKEKTSDIDYILAGSSGRGGTRFEV